MKWTIRIYFPDCHAGWIFEKDWIEIVLPFGFALSLCKSWEHPIYKSPFFMIVNDYDDWTWPKLEERSNSK